MYTFKMRITCMYTAFLSGLCEFPDIDTNLALTYLMKSIPKFQDLAETDYSINALDYTGLCEIQFEYTEIICL